MTFKARITAALRFLLSFRGRTGRLAFLLFFIPWTIATRGFVEAVFGDALRGTTSVYDAAYSMGLYGADAILVLAALVFFCWTLLALCFRRLHDLGFSGGWMVLVAFIIMALPYGGWLCAAVLIGTAGEEGGNRFGPEPLFPTLFRKNLRLARLDRQYAKGQLDTPTFNARRAAELARK